MYIYIDEAILCTNPEISSCRDSDKMVGFIASKSLRAITQNNNKTNTVHTNFIFNNTPGPVKQSLLITRYDPERAEKQESLHMKDITELLGLPVIGVIPESKSVLTSTNLGQPVIIGEDQAASAYKDVVKRFLGETVPLRYIEVEAKGFFSKWFNR